MSGWLAPALIETYSRLLVYTEIESLGIKGFLSQLLPQVFKSHAWGILYTLLEMFSYRIHHIQPHYRVQLLSHLHSLASVPHTNQMQLHLCVESTALRLITGLGSVEIQAHLSREPKTPGSIVSAESEELNRALILTLARSMQITGTGNDLQSNSWVKDLLTSIMQNTPHSWAQHTLQCFPAVLNDFFVQHNAPKENKQMLKKTVDEEYRNWASMSNENDIIAHFGVAGNPG
jgi:mediator of RNA polymerase II transcription subunit 23